MNFYDICLSHNLLCANNYSRCIIFNIKTGQEMYNLDNNGYSTSFYGKWLTYIHNGVINIVDIQTGKIVDKHMLKDESGKYLPIRSLYVKDYIWYILTGYNGLYVFN